MIGCEIGLVIDDDRILELLLRRAVDVRAILDFINLTRRTSLLPTIPSRAHRLQRDSAQRRTSVYETWAAPSLSFLDSSEFGDPQDRWDLPSQDKKPE